MTDLQLIILFLFLIIEFAKNVSATDVCTSFCNNVNVNGFLYQNSSCFWKNTNAGNWNTFQTLCNNAANSYGPPGCDVRLAVIDSSAKWTAIQGASQINQYFGDGVGKPSRGR